MQAGIPGDLALAGRGEARLRRIDNESSMRHAAVQGRGWGPVRISPICRDGPDGRETSDC